MSKSEIVYFQRKNFKVEVVLNEYNILLWTNFAESVLSAKPSRLDNVLEIEVLHRADTYVPMLIQSICDRGMQRLILRTVYPVPSKIADDPRCYMMFDYEDGHVTDQWTEMSYRDDVRDEFMIDVMKITFAKKMVSDCVWCTESAPILTIVGGTSHPRPC